MHNNDDDENIYILYGRAYDKLEKPDSSTWVFKKGLKTFPDSENLLYWAASSSSKEIRNGNTKKLDELLYFLEQNYCFGISALQYHCIKKPTHNFHM